MADVLIFDDDPSVGDLMGELLRGRGLTVSHFLSGAGVVQLVQENKPRLVVLDIMMPGMDGLTACRTLKSNPATKGAKIAILTAKNYIEDQEAAMRYGADLFLHKPFDPGAFAGSIGRMLGISEVMPPRPPAPPIVVTILPGSVVVETAGLQLVFDAGKGLKGYLERQTQEFPLTWFLISRFGPDNVSEISAGAALLARGGRVNLAGPDDAESRLQQLAPAMCADAPGGGRATPLLYPQREGEFALTPGGARAVTRLTQHSGTCLAYRVELQGRVLVYCPAHEIHPELAKLNKHEHEKFRDFFEDADLLLHGYRRSVVDEAPKDAVGSGAWEPVVDLAAAAGVKRIALLPMAKDAPTDGLQFRIEERLAAHGSKMRYGVTRFNERVIL
jgi:CheY-like chemotaxis protein